MLRKLSILGLLVAALSVSFLAGCACTNASPDSLTDNTRIGDNKGLSYYTLYHVK